MKQKRRKITFGRLIKLFFKTVLISTLVFLIAGNTYRTISNTQYVVVRQTTVSADAIDQTIQINNLKKFTGLALQAIDNQKERLVELTEAFSIFADKFEGVEYKPTNELIRANVYIYSKHGGGSGVVIQTNPGRTYILTAAHVIGESKRNRFGRVVISPFENLTVITSDKDKYKATIVRANYDDDIAVLSIRKKLDITPVEVAKDMPEVGDRVWNIGNPGGYFGLVNQGVVSLVSKHSTTISVAGFYGSSGSMVINTKGKIIGILSTVAVAQIGPFSPSLTPYNGVCRTDRLHEFLRGI